VCVCVERENVDFKFKILNDVYFIVTICGIMYISG